MEIEKRIEKYRDGTYAEIYHKKGDEYYFHREDGPAYIKYKEDNSINYVVYYINNEIHREDGPAWFYYNKDDSIQHEEYWVNDNRHRKDGPAWIEYRKDGSVYYEEYIINNNRIFKDEWEEQYGWKSKLKGTPMGEIFLTQN